MGMSPGNNAVLTGPWKFTSISQTDRHSLEVKIELTVEDSNRAVVFDTRRHKETIYRDWVKERDADSRLVRGHQFLKFPLNLEPASVAEGYIDFPVGFSGYEFLQSRNNTITVSDNISETSIKLLWGENYNATTGKRYDPRHPEKYK